MGKKKRHDRKSNGSRQKNKRGDSKKESNDSPEIPDRGETLDIASLPLGVKSDRLAQTKTNATKSNSCKASILSENRHNRNQIYSHISINSLKSHPFFMSLKKPQWGRKFGHSFSVCFVLTNMIN